MLRHLEDPELWIFIQGKTAGDLKRAPPTLWGDLEQPNTDPHMKNTILGFAFAGLALVSCQNPSSNNMEAAGAPGTAGACAMGGSCDMDASECGEAGECAMGAESCEGMVKEGCDGMKAECPMEDKN